MRNTLEREPERLEAAAEPPGSGTPTLAEEVNATVDENDRIAQRAYERYLMRGREHGHDREDWFEAEREVRERRGSQS